MHKICLSLVTTVACFFSFQTCFGQNEEEGPFRHHHVTATIGHGVLPVDESVSSDKSTFFIPTFGFAYEYQFNETYGIGLKNDIELTSYVIVDREDVALERDYPFSTSLVFLVNPIEGLGIYIGPGIEFSDEDPISVFGFGVSYEVKIPGYWDMSPELGYELKAGHTSILTVGLTVGKRFGKMQRDNGR